MTRYNRRTLLKAGAAFAGASAIGFPAISYGQAEKIKIGHLTPLTGFLGALGAYATLGMRMAEEEINRSGGIMGRPIEVISEDSVNPATAATKAQRMLEQDGVAVLGMKPMGAGLILQSKAASAEECLRYAMSVPGVNVTITGCDSEGVLEQALYLAINYKPMAEDERRALLERTRPAAQGGKWEKFKTTQQFDGTEQNKKWLTSAQL